MVERTHKHLLYDQRSPEDGNQNFLPNFCVMKTIIIYTLMEHIELWLTYYTSQNCLMCYYLHIISCFVLFFVFLTATIKIFSGKSGHSRGTLRRPTCLLICPWTFSLLLHKYAICLLLHKYAIPIEHSISHLQGKAFIKYFSDS